MLAKKAVSPTSDTALCRAAARRRRLHRGVELWDLDVKLSAEPARRAILITFTTTGNWTQEAQGRMRAFWQQVRHVWLDTRYFCWAELTQKGQLHYHAWWINPPHRKRVDLQDWIERHWGKDFVHVSWPRENFSGEYISSYVKKYVWKMGSKSAQQRYATMPSTFRTFMTNRLEIPPNELRDHTSKDEWVYSAGIDGLFDEYGPRLVCLGRRLHIVPPAGYCTAIEHRRKRKRPRLRWDRPPPPAKKRAAPPRRARRPAAPRSSRRPTSRPRRRAARAPGRAGGQNSLL